MVPVEDPQVITIDYCDPSECPGCPPWPVCDCAPVEQRVTISDTLISDPIGTPPVEQEQSLKGIRNGESKKWYKHRPTPIRQNRRHHRGHIHVQNCEQQTPTEPIESVPCMCPLILCAGPPLCECKVVSLNQIIKNGK